MTGDGEVRATYRRYRGIIDAGQAMWRREGLSGFFKGLIPNALRVAPAAAITFVVYESVLDFLE